MDGIIYLFIEAGPFLYVIILEDATLIFKKFEKQYKIRDYTTRDII